jgi:uncharacterized membrane protein
MGRPCRLLAVAIELHSRWHQISDRFPVYWDLEGRADGWVSRTFIWVYRPLIMAATISCLLPFINYSIAYHSKRIHAVGDSAKQERTFQRMTIGCITASSYLIVLAFSWGSFGVSRYTSPNPAGAMIAVASFT